MLYWKCEECDEINPYPGAKVCETCGMPITDDAIHKILQEQEEHERIKREQEEKRKVKQEQEKRERIRKEEAKKERIRQEQEEKKRIEWENRERIKKEKRKKYLSILVAFISFSILIVAFYIHDCYRIEQKFIPTYEMSSANSNIDTKRGYFRSTYENKLYIAGSIIKEGQCDQHKFVTDISGCYELETVTSNGESVNVEIQDEEGEVVYKGNGSLSLLEDISLKENTCYIMNVSSDSIDCDYSIQISFFRR